MKRIIPVIVALILILIIGGVYFGDQIMDKYAYSKETVDLDEYYGSVKDRAAIVLQDEMVEEKALFKDGRVYFDIDTVNKYLNDGFYPDYEEEKLLYTTAEGTCTAGFGQSGFHDAGGDKNMEYTICFMEDGALYIAADYVRRFTNYEYFAYDRYVQVYTEWGVRKVMTVSKDTQVRTMGGIKSPILKEVEKGEQVELLDQMETWSLIKTSDSVIGYVENKRLGDLSTDIETPVNDYTEPEHASLLMDGKVSLGWHYVGSASGGTSKLNEVLDECRISKGVYGINVIAPTWFSLCDNMGNFRSYAEEKYVQTVHDKGLKVWGVWDDFNYRLEVEDSDVSTFEVLSSTSARQKLENDIISTSLELGLDGVNIDFERVTEESGEHYVQFLKELSVLCQTNGLVLSVDNPVPFAYNSYYRMDIQGRFVDYVIIMGYDEHGGNSQEPGSVASIGYVSDGIDKTLEMVPSQKVVNALPFYSRLWRTEGTSVTNQAVTLENMDEYLDKADWDEETSQYYAQWEDGDAVCRIWLENVDSLRVKLNVMNTKKLGGVAVWRLGYGTAAAWELVNGYAGM